MSVNEQVCFTIACDGCKDPYEYDDYAPHFPSAKEAVDHAVNYADWWAGDNQLICFDCCRKPHAFVPDGSTEDCARCGNLEEEHDLAVTAPKPCCEFHDRNPEIMPPCGPDVEGGYCCDDCPTLAALRPIEAPGMSALTDEEFAAANRVHASGPKFQDEVLEDCHVGRGAHARGRHTVPQSSTDRCPMTWSGDCTDDADGAAVCGARCVTVTGSTSSAVNR